MVLVTFIISSELFWGFSVQLEPTWFVSLDAIVKCIHMMLQTHFKKNNMDVMYEKSKQLKFHIHDYTFENICTLPENSSIYVCDHGC